MCNGEYLVYNVLVVFGFLFVAKRKNRSTGPVLIGCPDYCYGRQCSLTQIEAIYNSN